MARKTNTKTKTAEAKGQDAEGSQQEQKTSLGSVTKTLKCQLTDGEFMQRSRSLAYAITRLNVLEEEKAEAMADFKARLKGQMNSVQAIKTVVAEGAEYRQVTCDQVADFTSNKVDTIRLDTGEVVDTRALEAWERQKLLPLEAEEGEGDQAE